MIKTAETLEILFDISEIANPNRLFAAPSYLENKTNAINHY